MLNLSLAEAEKVAAGYPAVRLYEEILADFSTPIAILHTVRKSSNNYFLLESVEGGEKWGRYSFIGFDPVMRLTAKDKKIVVRQGPPVEIAGDNPLACLRKILEDYRVPPQEGLPPFTGGFVGYFAYEFFKYCEPDFQFSAGKQADFPDLDLMLFDKVIALDHLLQKIFIIANVRTEHFAVNYCKAEREIGAIKQMLNRSEHSPEITLSKAEPLQVNVSQEEYMAKVEKAKEYIKAGDIFQVVLSQKYQAPYEQDLFSFYRLLRMTNPSQYMVLLKNDEVEIAGSSPETLLKINGRSAVTMPIAGTRPRGVNEEEDVRLEAELLADDKEIAEHNMLVDLGRNDLGRVCKFGTVKVVDYQKINRFSRVMHITSRVEGELAAGKDCLDALTAVFPAGTLSGAPKIRAMEIIDELEPDARGGYGGGMGYIDFSGNMDICITIRTALKKGGNIFIQAGAGIVADSVPENEYRECRAKAGALFQVLAETTEKGEEQ